MKYIFRSARPTLSYLRYFFLFPLFHYPKLYFMTLYTISLSLSSINTTKIYMYRYFYKFLYVYLYYQMYIYIYIGKYRYLCTLGALYFLPDIDPRRRARHIPRKHTMQWYSGRCTHSLFYFTLSSRARALRVFHIVIFSRLFSLPFLFIFYVHQSFYFASG